MRELIELMALVVLAVSIPVGIYLFYKAYKRITIVRLLHRFSKRDQVALLSMTCMILGICLKRSEGKSLNIERIAELAGEMADCMMEKLNKK